MLKQSHAGLVGISLQMRKQKSHMSRITLSHVYHQMLWSLKWVRSECTTKDFKKKDVTRSVKISFAFTKPLSGNIKKNPAFFDVKDNFRLRGMEINGRRVRAEMWETACHTQKGLNNYFFFKSKPIWSISAHLLPVPTFCLMRHSTTYHSIWLFFYVKGQTLQLFRAPNSESSQLSGHLL